MNNRPYLPPEWAQIFNAVLMAYPDTHTDWGWDEDAQRCCIEILQAIINEAELRVGLICHEFSTANDWLGETRLRDKEDLYKFDVPYNDTWARDFGMITVEVPDDDEDPVEYLDFRFNGWGLKFPANKDNRICRRLAEDGYIHEFPLINYQDFVLEGGSIETDGQRTLLTTSRCLLSPNRNPWLSKEQIEQVLSERLGIDRFLWLDHGYLEGDDTDSHIDTLARFLDAETIAYVKCYDPNDEHKAELDLMEAELKTFTTKEGKPYKLVPLPLPKAIFDEEGNRLPATYANFLITHKAVLVPTYGQQELDNIVLDIIRQHVGGRKVVGIDCTPLIKQHGSLHCATMQFVL